MAGFSDSPYRRIARRMGSGFSFTEFVSTDGIFRGNLKSLDMFRFHESERPIVFQVFGNDENTIIEAAKSVRELGPDAIDLNMGCSVRKVAMKGSGAGLLRDPLKVGRIIEGMVKELDIPVSAKIRLGWSSGEKNYMEILKILEESGVSLVSVHGRTKDQGYSGQADWNAIGEIKAKAKVPILGNGDITDVATAKRRMRETGVDGVLIGRAAIGNPWIFSGRDREDVPVDEVVSMILEHLDRMIEFYDEPHGLRLFRKHVVKYMRLFPGASNFRNRLVRCEDPGEFREIVREAERFQTPFSMDSVVEKQLFAEEKKALELL